MNNSQPLHPSSLAETERQRLAKLAVLELENRKCLNDPWYFIKTYCVTEDEQDPTTPLKLFPKRCHQYLSLIVAKIQTEKLLAIEKSRQVMVTWIVCAYLLWLLIYRPSQRIVVQSKKQEDANANLERMADMYSRLPLWIQKRNPLRITNERIKNQKNGSSARAIPQGEDQAKGYTVSLHWSDETAAQDGCASVWKAVKPTLGAGKGRFVATSSAKGGTWMHSLVEDRLEPGQPPSPVYSRELCHGLTERKLARNSFTVLRLHYTADSEKRSSDWYRSAKEGMVEADWQQEMEVNWMAYSGIPALPRFPLYRDKILFSPFEIPSWWKRYACADYGYRNPYACIFVAIGPDDVAYAYWEYYSPGPLDDHLAVIKAHPDFSLLQAYILDASCWAATQQDGHQVRSVAELHEDKGVYPLKAHVVQDRLKINAWDTVWPDLSDQTAQTGFRISRALTNTIRELEGIRWAEYTPAVQKDHNFVEKLVDKDNHAFDALSYFHLFRQDGASVQTTNRPQTEDDARRQMRLELQQEHLRAVEEEASMNQGDLGDGLDG